MIRKNNNSGWILCPSKSFPGKFYYFNVLNGEAAWCLNDNEKKVLKKEATKQNVKINHLYPEPITPPDHSSPIVSHYHSTIRTCSSIFGQATYPKYISNVNENRAIRMPQLFMKTKQTRDQKTQTEQNNIYVHTCTIPLSKRFENIINESESSSNYEGTTQTNNWWNKTNNWSNICKQSYTETAYKRKLDAKPLKESKLKRLEQTNKFVWNTSVQNSTKSHLNKDENLKSLNNLDTNDLRYVLKAKRIKYVKPDLYNKEHTTINDKKVITYNNNYKFYSKNKNGTSRYVVVDLDVLLEDCDYITAYIDNDEHCNLYIPRVIRNELKFLSAGEHGDRSRVLVARQSLRQLAPYVTTLNLPENKYDTTINQIIKCCLEITKRNYEVVLITKNIELLEAARLYNLKVYHINDIKYKKNLFLQNKSDFDPFIISRIVSESQDCSRISNTTTGLNNLSDVSDINHIINRLKITDNDKDKVDNIDKYELKSFNDKRVSTTKLSDENLKQYYIKNKNLEDNLFVRFDELICCYEQIIEDFIHIILQNQMKQTTHPPPWSLREGMKCLREIHTDDQHITEIIDKLLYYYISDNDTNMKPYNFMKLLGCGVSLVEALEKTSPVCIKDIRKKLINLRDLAERPLDDALVDTAEHTDTHTDNYNFVKDPSYVLDYMKRNYSEWDYNAHNDSGNGMKLQNDNIKVVRTVGRHLDKLTINKSKCMSFVKHTDGHTNNDTPKVIRNIDFITFDDKMKYADTGDSTSVRKCIAANDVMINDNITDINDTRDSVCHADSLVRMFLSELNISFKRIHAFIEEIVEDRSEDKYEIKEKVNKIHTHISHIMDTLQIIIQRETEESLLIKHDKVNRYRSVVMKCLEQATMIGNSLKLIVELTEDD